MNNDSKTYYKKIHRFGMIVTAFAMVVFFGVPILACLKFDIMPSMKDVVLVAGGICAIFIPVSMAEIIAETPVMGSSSYIASITGNITNIKLPACINAMKVANVKAGSSEADAVSGVAVCASSLVTIVMVALGVLLMTPLRPFLESPVISTAAGYVLPALMGAIALVSFGEQVGGGVRIRGRWKTFVAPVIIAVALFFFIMPDSYENMQGFIAIGLLVVMFVISKIMYKKGTVVVEMPDDGTAAAAAADEEVN